MGAIGLFAAIISELAENNSKASAEPLDRLAANYGRYAYIGSRKSLADVVLAESHRLVERVRKLPDRETDLAKSSHPQLAARIEAIRRCATDYDAAEVWFTPDWEKDSGLFPDFVLAADEQQTFGNGALLELKDTRSKTLASFNSTIPTRHKSLDEVQEIMGSRAISAAAALGDFPLSVASDYLTADRPCFYLLRTCAAMPESVCISLVEGSFFETLPKGELLARTWDQLLEAAGMPPAERSHVVESLARLDQTEIAKSRSIAEASVRPRLRLMAEVVPSANPHNYDEIVARSVNLIAKAEWPDDAGWIRENSGAEGVPVEVHPDGTVVIKLQTGQSVQLRHFRIVHKLNGEHLVLQYCLPAGADPDAR
jgi:hypothetical protein